MSGLAAIMKGWQEGREANRKRANEDEDREYQKQIRPLQAALLKAQSEIAGGDSKIKTNEVDRLPETNKQADERHDQGMNLLKKQIEGAGYGNAIRKNEVDRLPTTNQQADDRHGAGMKLLGAQIVGAGHENAIKANTVDRLPTTNQQADELYSLEQKGKTLANLIAAEKWDHEKGLWSDQTRILVSQANIAETQEAIAALELKNQEMLQLGRTQEAEVGLMTNIAKQNAMIYKLFKAGDGKAAAQSLNRVKTNDITSADNIVRDSDTNDVVVIDKEGRELKRWKGNEMALYENMLNPDKTATPKMVMREDGTWYRAEGTNGDPVIDSTTGQPLKGKTGSTGLDDSRYLQIPIITPDGRKQMKNYTQEEAYKQYHRAHGLASEETLRYLQMTDTEAWRRAMKENAKKGKTTPKYEEWLGAVMTDGIQLGKPGVKTDPNGGFDSNGFLDSLGIPKDENGGAK